MASKESDMATTVHHEERDCNLDATDGYLKENEKTDPYMSEVQIDAATDKRLFWKITRRVLVIQVITYFCQSLDKGILNYASIMGLKDDTHLVGQQVRRLFFSRLSLHIADASTQYSWLGTILYIGIIAGEYPQNLLLQKLPVAKTLALNVFIWGVVVTCSAACNNFGSLMAVRFLLGFFESCVQPAMMLVQVYSNLVFHWFGY
jgi:MFS family permease